MQLRRPLAWLLLGVALVSCGSDNSNGPRVPASIVITPDHPVVAQGDTLRLTAKVVDAAGNSIRGQHPTFSSADSTVATVDATGLVTSLGQADSVRITASLGQLSSFVDLAVIRRAVAIHVTPDSVHINVTGSDQLFVELLDFVGLPVPPTNPITYHSSDTSVAKVNPSGLVYSTSQKSGTATITVTADTFVAHVVAQVVQFAASIETSPLVVVLPTGGTRQVSLAVRDSQGLIIPSPIVSFQSGAPALFSVSQTGLVSSIGSTGGGDLQVTSNNVVVHVPVYVGAPPPGTLINRVPVPGPAYASILTAAGEMLVTLPTTNFGVRGNLSTLNFTDTLTTLSDPLGVSVNPAGTRAYVALRGSARVAVVDLATRGVTLSGQLGGGGAVFSTAVSSNGLYLFVGASSWLYRLNASSLAVIDSVVARDAIHLAIHPTQNLLYVSNNLGDVQEVNWGLPVMVVARGFVTGPGSQGVAVASDGSRLYVANESGIVTPYNLGTGAAETALSVPGAFGLSIAGNTLYVVSSLGGMVYAFDRTTGTPIYAKSVTGVPRRPSINAAGILIVPNEGGWVDFIQ